MILQSSKKLTKNAVLNLTLCCSTNWRRREKLQYRCTITVHHVHKSPKDILENLLPLWLLVRTNLFIPSRFWTTHTKFDTCCLERRAEKNYIGAHLHFPP